MPVNESVWKWIKWNLVIFAGSEPFNNSENPEVQLILGIKKVKLTFLISIDVYNLKT